MLRLRIKGFTKIFVVGNGDIRNPIEDHEMCVHLFGGILSPICSNYALKRTSVDNEKEFGIDVARTVRRNFYVDDMLKFSKLMKQ